MKKNVKGTNMNIKVEYKNSDGKFNGFLKKMGGKKVSVLCDYNTRPFADKIIADMEDAGATSVLIYFDDKDLIPDEKVEAVSLANAKGTDYLLAVGSGSLNDMGKCVSTKLNIPCGCLATAASMDGYCSKGSAIMRGGFKVTDVVHTPEDVLIDADIIKTAPKLMTASGFGDIVGKFTCLTDWELAHIIKGEPINVKAFRMMEDARTKTMDAFEDLTEYKPKAIETLMDALIMAGISMAECGNSRPASGSEHHMSHFLEMDFVRRGERVPLHGVKVAIGTLISIEIYNYIKDNKIRFVGAEEVYKLVDKLPKVETVKSMLMRMGCPVRFSEIGVRKETFLEMVEKAHTVRDRYTVLTLASELGLNEKLKPILSEKYF